MKLYKLHVVNFGSYKELEFNFDKLGLSLIYGATGSGKSTILDMAAWVLFGCTAKDGNADEVKSWLTPDETTVGELDVLIGNTIVTIKRTRAKGAKNDLFWTESTRSGETLRGKDITDTQRLLEAHLGVTKELYLAGAYFHEFSSTGHFFSTTARNRRELLEKIARTELAAVLSRNASEARKSDKVLWEANSSQVEKSKGRLEGLVTGRARSEDSSLSWRSGRDTSVAQLKTKIENFEIEKKSKIETCKTKAQRWDEEHQKCVDKIVAKIERIPERPKGFKCPACGGNVADRSDLLERLKEVSGEENPYTPNIGVWEEWENHYGIELEAKLKEVNPFDAQIAKIAKSIGEAQEELDKLQNEQSQIKKRIDSLTYLQDLSAELRGELLKKAVYEIEMATNGYLERYFDSELKVTFSLGSADNLEVGIEKSGYECVYRQLSKGQRGLLKLCFAVSVMKAASNKAGVHFSNLFFDEALDGLDANLKVKAFDLFQELEKEHESILVVEHSAEFQNLFNRRFKVTMQSDESSIEEENE